MTQEEKRTVLAVFGALLEKPYYDLNMFLGSETIRDMQSMYTRLKYSDYCKRHGITYEAMDADDFIRAESE